MAFAPVPLGERAPERVVPAGIYPLGAKAGGSRRVGPCSLDRDLVTVLRFARFIEAGGYEAREHWSDEGWEWRRDQGIEAPRFWGDEGWPLWRRFLTATRPIVGVSYHEAVAFAEYEGRRLPTSAEWEAAVRGPAGFAYPWGPDWEAGRVGVRGVGPRVTWPVRSFPRAVGPFGHEDLVGNVWQWTADEEGAHALVRGGSWASRPEQCGADHFNAYAKDGRHSHVGFRTAAR